MQVLTTAPDPLSPQLNATEAATTSGAARTTAVRVAFSVKLDGGGGGGGGSGGGGDDDVSLPPEEVRLHVSLPTGNRPACKCSLRRLSPSPHRYACTSRSQRAIGLHASAHYGARPLFPQVRLHVSLPTGNRPACKCSLRRPSPLPTGTLARLAPNGLSASKGDAALHAVASHAARSGELSDCMLIAC